MDSHFLNKFFNVISREAWNILYIEMSVKHL